MKTLNEIDREEIINDCLTPVFTYMDPGFAAIVLENMLRDYMNTPAWNIECSGRRANIVNTIGVLSRLLNDISCYFPHDYE